MCNTTCSELIKNLLNLTDLAKSDCDLALVALERITMTVSRDFIMIQMLG